MSAKIELFHRIQAPAKHKLKGDIPSANFEAKKETLKTSSTKVRTKNGRSGNERKAVFKNKNKKVSRLFLGRKSAEERKVFRNFLQRRNEKKSFMKLSKKEKFFDLIPSPA